MDTSNQSNQETIVENNKEDGIAIDRTSYAPFVLENALDTQWHDIRLSFNQWKWLEDQYGLDSIDGYYLNGYGIEGLIKALLLTKQIDPDQEDIYYNSESDTCYVHFQNAELALLAAKQAATMFKDFSTLKKLVTIARENGFED